MGPESKAIVESVMLEVHMWGELTTLCPLTLLNLRGPVLQA